MFHRGNTPCGFVLIKNVNGMLSGVRMKPVDEVLASPIVQKTAFWSEVKKNLGVGTGAYAFKLPKSDVAGCSGQSGSQEADVMVVQQQLDAQHSIAYVPYGPEIEPVDGMHGPFLEELSESLRAYLPPVVLRFVTTCAGSLSGRRRKIFMMSGDSGRVLPMPRFRKCVSILGPRIGVSKRHRAIFYLPIRCF